MRLASALPVTTRLLFKSRFAIVTPDAPGLNISRRIRDEELRDGLSALAEDTPRVTGRGPVLLTNALIACPAGHPVMAALLR